MVNGGDGWVVYGFSSTPSTRNLPDLQPLDQRARLVFEQQARRLGVDRLLAVRRSPGPRLELAGRGIEVAAGHQPLPAECHQVGLEGLAGERRERRAQVPERRAHEALALPRALDHQPDRHRLDAARRQCVA